MAKNAIEMRVSIDNLIDRVRSPRFGDDRYYDAINQAQARIIDDRTENIKNPKTYSVEAVQRVREELDTLTVDEFPIVPVGNIIAKPANYFHHLSLDVVIDGDTNYARATTHNAIGPLKRDPFRKPSNKKPYYLNISTGIKIERGSTGAFTNSLLSYLKLPDEVTIGTEADKITPASGNLTNGVTYYVYEDTIHNGIERFEGETFVAIAAPIVGGVVINSSNVTDSDLPGRIHEEVIRLAAGIMMGSDEDYNKKVDLQRDNAQS